MEYMMKSNAQLLRDSAYSITRAYGYPVQENFSYNELSKLKKGDQFRIVPGAIFYDANLSFEAQQVLGTMPNTILTVTDVSGGAVTVADSTGSRIIVPASDTNKVKVMLLTSSNLFIPAQKPPEATEPPKSVMEGMNDLKPGDVFKLGSDNDEYSMVGKDKDSPDTYVYRNRKGVKKRMHKDDAEKSNITIVKEVTGNWIVKMSEIKIGDKFRFVRPRTEELDDKTIFLRCSGPKQAGITFVSSRGSYYDEPVKYANYTEVELIKSDVTEDDGFLTLDKLFPGDRFYFINKHSGFNTPYQVKEKNDMYAIYVAPIDKRLSEIKGSFRSIMMPMAASTPIILVGTTHEPVSYNRSAPHNLRIQEDFLTLASLNVGTYFMLLSATADTLHPLSQTTKQMLTFSGSRQLLQVKSTGSGGVTVGSAIGYDIVIPSSDASRIKVTPLTDVGL